MTKCTCDKDTIGNTGYCKDCLFGRMWKDNVVEDYVVLYDKEVLLIKIQDIIDYKGPGYCVSNGKLGLKIGERSSKSTLKKDKEIAKKLINQPGFERRYLASKMR